MISIIISIYIFLYLAITFITFDPFWFLLLAEYNNYARAGIFLRIQYLWL